MGRPTMPSSAVWAPNMPARVSARPNSSTKYTATQVPSTTVRPKVAPFTRPSRHDAGSAKTDRIGTFPRRGGVARDQPSQRPRARPRGTAQRASARRQPTWTARNGSVKIAVPMPSCMQPPSNPWARALRGPLQCALA